MAPVPIDENRITYFAETDARNRRLKFGIKAKDRTRHVYVIGKTGMGKSTLLENLAVQDIQNGEGMCFIDPHGKTADLLLEYVPKERINDVIYIAPFDVDYPISFNVLESVDPTKRHLVVSGLMSTFKKIWEDAWSARMEYILTNTLLALLEAPNTTLLGVNRMLSDKAYRNEIVSHVTDPSVKAFWVKEFANYTERMAAEAVPSIQNKVGQFTANPLIRNMIGQPTSSFDFRQAMDSRKIIVINLSKGRIGDENMKLLGGLLVTKIYLSAMSRADVPDRVMKMLPNFYLFVDEFQNFANASFADILSEARKYKLNLTIAHQYVEQMDEIVRPAVFGNVGTMISFRVGANDAELLEKEFAPVFVVEDLVNLGFAQIYLKLMIDGLSSSPFSATTLPPIPHPDTSYVKEIVDASRRQFARPRVDVEVEIVKFHEPTPSPVAAKKVAPATSAVPVAPAASNSSSASKIGTLAAAAVPVKIVAPATPAISVVISKPVPTTPPTSKPVQPAPPKPVPQKVVVVEPKPLTKIAPPPTIPTSTPTPNQPSMPSKPVSLSSLAPKTTSGTPRPDPKVPSAQNISELKNALAMALNKTKSGAQSTQIPQASKSIPTPVKIADEFDEDFQPLETLKGLKPVQKISADKKMPTPAVSVSETKPAEVPEEVLKNVLKME